MKTGLLEWVSSFLMSTKNSYAVILLSWVNGSLGDDPWPTWPIQKRWPIWPMTNDLLTHFHLWRREREGGRVPWKVWNLWARKVASQRQPLLITHWPGVWGPCRNYQGGAHGFSVDPVFDFAVFSLQISHPKHLFRRSLPARCSGLFTCYITRAADPMFLNGS